MAASGSQTDRWWLPKFAIDGRTPVAVAGGDFAQQIAPVLRERKLTVIDSEPPPPGLDGEAARTFGYLTGSARFGHLGTARQLAQLAREACAGEPLDGAVLEKDGRFIDAFRPAVEPGGLGSAARVIEHRRQHLARVRAMLDGAGVFIFTLTDARVMLHRETGQAFPADGGLLGFAPDPGQFAMRDFSVAEVCDDLVAFRAVLKQCNPDARILLTVSGAPLAAAADGRSLLAANGYAKAVLRAAAGQFADSFDDADYFPAYELMTLPMRRTGEDDDADRVMRRAARAFLDALGVEASPQKDAKRARAPSQEERERAARAARKAKRRAPPVAAEDDDLVCEENLLEAFGQAETPAKKDAKRAGAPPQEDRERAARAARKAKRRAPPVAADDDDDLVCEENLLEAFGR